jgi:hypothetical protein
VSNIHIVASNYEKLSYVVVSVTVLPCVKVSSSVHICVMKTFFIEELYIGRFRTCTRLSGLCKFTEFFFLKLVFLSNIHQN